MGNANIKERLINQINTIQDNALLEEIFEYVIFEQKLLEDLILSSENEKSLLKTYQEVKSGNYLTNDQANEEASKWLRE